MTVDEMRRHAMLIGAAASMLMAGTAALSLSNASAIPPGPGRGFGFIARREQPVAGHPWWS
jgi:hypothetical protein